MFDSPRGVIPLFPGGSPPRQAHGRNESAQTTSQAGQESQAGRVVRLERRASCPLPGPPSGLPSGSHRYAELHAHSAYSFLDGANEPEELLAVAAELGLEALALTDHDGVPGIVRHAQAGRTLPVATVHGSELTLADGTHLPVLARGVSGYRNLVTAISRHNLQAGRRQEPAHHVDTLASALDGTCLVLTGTSRGPLRHALGDPRRPRTWNLAAARTRLGQMMDMFGPDNLAVEITLDGTAADAAVSEVLLDLARTYHLPLLATGAVRCARPMDAALADVLSATRLRRDLEGAHGILPPRGRWLRSGEQMADLHRWVPEAVDATVDVAQDLAFDLSLVAPQLPSPCVPEGHTPSSWLRELTRRGGRERYGTRQQDPHAWRVLDHELEVIDSLGFAGYFLIVREIVEFCQQAGILCQGRGSAANSAVCYALGITAVDAVRHQMLFERFLSPGRRGYPDIDLDIEACRREEVIQHVYSRYGRERAAQVATVISYRPRLAVRDAARALGYPAGLQDAWAGSVERGWSRGRRGTAQKWADEPAAPRQVVSADATSACSTSRPGPCATGTGDTVPGGPAVTDRDTIPEQVRQVADQLLLLPRHLGIHSGGMVLTATPVAQVCPVRWAAMPGRTVLQWDKDDCADAGLVKFDLLGLGMLTALRLAFASLAERGERVPDLAPGTGTLRPAQIGRPWELHTLPEDDPAVYRLLSAADTIGVFQVESRAQMATLPRLRPQTFYDIVVEVALIRPGPIQGDVVNPYIRRRLGREPVTYAHPLLRPALEKTLGVPLFQEQLMQIAIDAAGFSPAEADSLRQAMGAKRSLVRMEALHARLVEGMRGRGIPSDTAEEIFDKLKAFADFGFPESHAFSFAYLVYASAWLKVRRPEDFYAGVLAAQPMGFWSPQTLVADARRHGVRVERADINVSGVQAIVEHRQNRAPRAATASQPSDSPNAHGTQGPRQEDREPGARVDGGVRADGNPPGFCASEDLADSALPDPSALTPLDIHPHLAVRLGIAPIKGIGRAKAEAIVTERQAHGPYLSVADLARRVRLSRRDLETLATAGTLGSLGVTRREGLWAAGALAGEYGRRGTYRSTSSIGTCSRPVEAKQRIWYQPPIPGTAVGAQAPDLGTMSAWERNEADIALTGVSTETHPLRFLRGLLSQDGIRPIIMLSEVSDGTRVRIAGVVTHRQRPHTAAGTVFLNLEDETGLLNVICPRGMWRRYRCVGRRAAALIVRGRVEQGDGVTALLAEHLEVLPGVRAPRSRDWA